MRLVDHTEPFQVAYSIYHHEYLGYLISAHYVQLLPNGSLSLVHQGAYPDNISQFSHGLEEGDSELIKLSGEILPREIIKKFGGNPRQEAEFFLKRFDGEVKKLIDAYIQRRLASILPLLRGKHVFAMGKDSYPAQHPIKVLEEEASVLFHFRRKETFTRYFPTIKLREEKIEFQNKGAIMLCLDPAWILLEGEIFTFEEHLDGKKLKPFLLKEFISIPREREEEYYRKFVTQIVERYPVYAKGFEIRQVHKTPEFSLLVQEHDQNAFSFSRQVGYDRFHFPLDKPGGTKASFEIEEGEYLFYKVIRDTDAEAKIRTLLDGVAPNSNSLTPWEYVDKEKGLQWLSAHSAELQGNGVRIIQSSERYQITLDRPEVVISTQESGDWFDIKAVVRIGAFEIPFIKFKQHILRNKREYLLPDGTVAILPDEWFSDYRHLMEVSDEPNGEVLRIKKYQAPLLNFPSTPNGLKEKIRNLANYEGVPEVTPPKNLKAKLRNYQEEGYNWLHFMKEQGMGGILADDMGLGKTLQTLSLLQSEYENGAEIPTLVVLPTSLIHNWQKEATKFTPDLTIHLHIGVGRTKDLAVFASKHLIITTYGIVRQDIELLKDFPFHYVVLDESQMIKNPDSKTAKAVRKLAARHRLSLTGTPIENTVMDIWSQMSFLNPGLLGNESFFKKFYVLPIERESDEKRSEKLRRIIYPFILRRKKEQVEKDLPPKIEKLHYCGMTSNQQSLYEETKNTYRNYLMELISQNIWKKNKLNILTGLQKLRQIAIHPKMLEPDETELKDSGKYQEVKRMLQTVLSKEGSKVLIFSQFVKMLHILRDDLKEQGITYNYLDGATKDRQGQVDSFQENDDIRVFLISLKAGGVGLNLTAADYVFILDPWWNPAVESQAVDRSHRIGQKHTVIYYKFITKDTIEEKILNLQRVKAKLSDDIIAVEEDIYKSLDAVDLEELLK
ncbi:SNF2-related protein [Pontibacter sp. G13]|uniref:DEAD/DEAH box helicase n=1 Tax=Pontibacter sp. G13 TaxID=3074898 RepID=UPI00288B19E2|nr:SNF2-related protein [Pontibacter sp. G13]WNJ18644.1 SNF2-related protein [Pontibacter sp. G13]